MRTLEQRIGDKGFMRLVSRLLKNSVLHADGKLAEKTTGTPQGSPISPILANICLHVILDSWFQENWAAKGELIRYADDPLATLATLRTYNEAEREMLYAFDALASYYVRKSKEN